jgi:hypothetical protein
MSTAVWTVKGTTPWVGLRGVTADDTLTLPARSRARSVYFRNNTANAVTGGVKIGTTLGGTDFLNAFAVGASTEAHANTAITAYATTDQTLYVAAVTDWNGANIDILIEYATPPWIG